MQGNSPRRFREKQVFCSGRISCFFSVVFGALSFTALAEVRVTHPYRGVTWIERTETVPRVVAMHVVRVNLKVPGIRFKLTPPGGIRDTRLQTTAEFLEQERAQVALNGHFYVPFPASDDQVNVVGFAASEGRVYSGFEPQPVAPGYVDQSYAIVANAPALNIDSRNRVTVLHRDPVAPEGRRPLEPVEVGTALAGSAQIVTDGVATIPGCTAAPGGLFPVNGYSESNSWNSQLRARTAMGVTRDGAALVLFTVDQSGSSRGMTTLEVARVLIRDYDVDQAINLDGGPSTTLVLEDPTTHRAREVSANGAGGHGNPVGSNLAVFAPSDPGLDASLRIWITTSREVVLSWPAVLSGWNLESLPGPGASDWELETRPPELRDNSWVFRTVPTGAARYFRLREPEVLRTGMGR
ncbi:MAG: phosphodiester glycosidase family protein [Verrucomicrobiota bacterium]